MITAIDPGTHESAVVRFDGNTIESPLILPNADMMTLIRTGDLGDDFAVEMIACYGMAVGKEVFETCLLIGRIQEAVERQLGTARLIYRRDVKIWLCGTMKAKDPNIRQALIDKHGAPGTKKAPGKLYGISSHLWSALAIADYALNNPSK